MTSYEIFKIWAWENYACDPKDFIESYQKAHIELIERAILTGRNEAVDAMKRHETLYCCDFEAGKTEAEQKIDNEKASLDHRIKMYFTIIKGLEKEIASAKAEGAREQREASIKKLESILLGVTLGSDIASRVKGSALDNPMPDKTGWYFSENPFEAIRAQGETK